MATSWPATVEGLLAALGDDYTREHCLRVSNLAVAIGRQLGLSPGELQLLQGAGLLHDVGKIAVPQAILAKPGTLSPEEFALIKAHPLWGQWIIHHRLGLPSLGAMVRHHHERFDGRGYPDGISGEHIPPLARIIAVADAWDAMTSFRPYRDRLSALQAEGILQEGRGSQFCPHVVDAFQELRRRGIDKYC
ncbi:MAG: HD-GYP domain-containing protein [Limnochordia bacterium]